ncbi:hypothetical protein [Novipirellula rosea]|uniref:Core-binding (CB) domain-containing protein n=1 Tax=Novipirellula rosea TaxID=1031540 RepID=A0ABP8N890_9BACT
MARNRKSRRQQHGSAWHWKQTDCWYYTPSGTKKRQALFDEAGERVRGKDNREVAQLALARIKLAEELSPAGPVKSREWTVAQVCEIYLSDLTKTACPEWVVQCKYWLNDFCGYCGALTVHELKKKHLRTWLERHKTWNNNTQRNVIGCVKAAFNFCCKFDDLDANPVSSYEKPAATARVTCFSPEEETQIYAATNTAHALFLKGCILTGARPYSELAVVTADHVVETPHGLFYLLKARTPDGSFGHKAAKKTGKDRRIMLCDEMEQITRRLILASPKGSGVPLFRTMRGKPWSQSNGVQQFSSLKKKLELAEDRVTYTCRHTFAKRTLSGYYTGKPAGIEVLAGLMGNTPKLCWDHYAQWADDYNDPLWAALGKTKKKRKAG